MREPIALAEHDGELLVVGGDGAQLVRLKHDSLTITARLDLPREPRGC